MVPQPIDDEFDARRWSCAEQCHGEEIVLGYGNFQVLDPKANDQPIDILDALRLPNYDADVASSFSPCLPNHSLRQMPRLSRVDPWRLRIIVVRSTVRPTSEE